MEKWYDKAVFYHIYPLGLCGCAKQNDGVTEENHFNQLNEWIGHIKKIGCTGIYIGPLFESVGHGYETTDYKKVDRRLGTNEDFKQYVKNCHAVGIKVIVDGVFNHTGREFFAFKDLKENRENSAYKDWYCNVNFYGNNEYNDGFSYENWGGYNLLVKLNQRNQEVKDYIYDVIRFWVSEFDIDGIRLDAADVLDFDFMKGLRHVANEVKPDFWLMGEVIHGDYGRWANADTLHSVTNYELHKGLFSGHNDHNYFEIAHTVQRLQGICGDVKLYTFIDNHDVARIYNKLNNKAHLYPVHLLLYGLPGIPSIYYGSEFCIEGAKEQNSDDSLRPHLDLAEYKHAYEDNDITKLIIRLGQIHKEYKELVYGRYQQLLLTNRQYVFGRILDNSAVIVAVNNDDNPSEVTIDLPIAANRAIDLLKVKPKTPEEEEQEKLLLEGKQKEAAEKKQKEAVEVAKAAVESAEILLEKVKLAAEGANSLIEKEEAAVHDTEIALMAAKEAVAKVEALYRAEGMQLEVEGGSHENVGTDCEIALNGNRLTIKMDGNRGTMIRIFQE